MHSFVHKFRQCWHEPNGFREVLAVGLPLVASMLSTTIMQFTDRVFLGQYSLEALAASLSASITNFAVLSFFIGVAAYLNVFVAQYTGAREFEKVGRVVWQGVYFTVFAGLCMASTALFAEDIFSLAGHSRQVQELEVAYYSILCKASGFAVLGACLSTFYSGRGLTRPVMLVNMTGAVLNIPLNYMLIYGVWIFPELGIRGAGYATATAWCLNAGIFAMLIALPRENRRYAVLTGWRFQPALFRRFLRFGVPGGVQFALDIFGFMFFILMVGRLSDSAAAATNMVFSFNEFTFLPMVGMHIATETLTGQAIGRKKPEEVFHIVRRVLQINLSWGICIALIFILCPGPLIELFRPAEYSAAQYARMHETGRVLLWFVAGYTVFDAVAITYQGALKGAGDTTYTMLLSFVLSFGTIIFPTWLIIEVFNGGLYESWWCVGFFIISLATGASVRFYGGKWRQLDMIAES